jgi:glyoxalase family protein
MELQLGGFHHLTAVTAQASENRRFYTEVIGLRLVKKTVNQDDVSAYHLFYGDGAASPGSDITFFDWPAPREERGSSTVTRTGFRVGSDASLEWWANWLGDKRLPLGKMVQRNGRLTLDFEDPEGQRLSLVSDAAARETHPWERSPIPAEHQIIGLGPIRMTVRRLEPTERVLLRLMNMKKLGEYQSEGDMPISVYGMAAQGASAELHVEINPSLPMAHPGAGGVHHVAFRTPSFEEYDRWAERLDELGVRSSGPIDRFYFRSLYFREPNGVLFEIATDGPGFATDESIDSLGERLSLPPFLEPRRAEIERGLKPI